VTASELVVDCGNLRTVSLTMDTVVQSAELIFLYMYKDSHPINLGILAIFVSRNWADTR
jgi:hypothetical protein